MYRVGRAEAQVEASRCCSTVQYCEQVPCKTTSTPDRPSAAHCKLKWSPTLPLIPFDTYNHSSLCLVSAYHLLTLSYKNTTTPGSGKTCTMKSCDWGWSPHPGGLSQSNNSLPIIQHVNSHSHTVRINNATVHNLVSTWPAMVHVNTFANTIIISLISKSPVCAVIWVVGN